MSIRQSTVLAVVLLTVASHAPLPAADVERQPAIASTDAEMSKAAESAAKNPKSAEAWIRVGDAFMQKGRETLDASYCGRAEGAYRKALQIDPKLLEAFVGLSWVNGVRHEFEASIDWARKALEIDPKCTSAHGLIGDAAVEMGNYDQAFDEYQKMLDLRPDLSSYSRSGHLLFVVGDSRKASLLMSKGIQAGGTYAENTAWCRSQLALMYFAQGGYVPAAQMLELGLKAAPGDYRLLAAMGHVKAALKDFPAAIDFYKKAVAIAPQQDSVAALGDLYAVTGQTELAKQQYALVESIAQINKANGVSGDMLTAKFYADHDRNLAEAVKMEEEEYKTRKNVYVADTLAWGYYKTGRIDDAKKLIAVALSRKTPEAAFYFHKGMIYAKAGDRVAAQQALYEAMSLSPGFDPLQAIVAMKALADLGGQPIQTK